MAAILLASSLAVGRGPVIWAPQPGSQTIFLACPIYECLMEGTRGAAKTDALLMDFAKDVGQGYGAAWRGILFRETYKQLDDIVARTRRWFPQIFPKARFNESSMTWRFADGEELLLRYMERPADYWNYHGHEYPWIGWEELTNWPDLECYESMKACSRSSVTGVPRRIRATANPFGVGHHAVKAYFVDPAPAGKIIHGETGMLRVRVHAHWSENVALLKADPEYPMRLASDTNASRRKAWLHGDWDIVAGGFFDDLWNRDVHVVKPFMVPTSWYLDRSYDHGSSRPFSVGWWAESDGTTAPNGTTYPRGTLFRVNEWYGSTGKPNEGLRMRAADIAKGVLMRQQEMQLQFNAGPADTQIFNIENGMSIGADMLGAGVHWLPADKSPGSRKTRWEKLRARLHAATAETKEDPALYVFDFCKDFIRTVPVLPRHPRKIDDIDDRAEDHVADETGYRLLSPRSEWIPVRVSW